MAGVPRKSKPVIGWREWLALPDLGIAGIKAKIDTGARSSALHAFDIEVFDRDGQRRVRFKVHPFQQDTATTVEAEAELYDLRSIRSSGGHESLRPVILAGVELAGQRWTIELTLTRRDAMGFRMLLGRQAVRRRFRIEPGKSFLLSRRPERPDRSPPTVTPPNPSAGESGPPRTSA